MANQTDDLRLGAKQVQTVAPAFSPPNSWVARMSEPAQTPAMTAPEDRAPSRPEVGTLIIGPEISFVGEITACKRLVVDGLVEATLSRCQEVVVGESGFLKGQARTETADVRGRVEGELTVRKLLRIRAAGQVSGTTTYGEIEIERGGRIIGQTEAREGAQSGRDW
jgi:cytoskeletal protein CcmA (bactofilin family)